jgi:hypothetical protein
MKHRCEDLEGRLAAVFAGEPGAEEEIETQAAALTCESCRRQLARYQRAYAELLASFKADPVALELGPERLTALWRKHAEMAAPASDLSPGANPSSSADRDGIIYFIAPLRRAIWPAALVACAALASVAGFEASGKLSRERRAHKIVRSLSNEASWQSADGDANLLPRRWR